jgi:DNA polymerase-3 subunit delta
MKKLFHGKNSHLSYQNYRKEFDELVLKNPDLEIEVIEADSTEVDKVAESYKNVGMFSSGKIIVVKNLSSNKRYPEIIEDLKTADLSMVYLLVIENEKVASNTKYFKLFSEKNEICESADMNKRTFITWLKDLVKSENLNIEQDAIYLLAENCNYETERVSNELVKYKLSGLSTITTTSIKEISPDTFENDIWQLIESINSTTDIVKSITILENLFEHNVDSYYIMAMLNRNLRQLVLVKELLAIGVDSKMICSKLKIPPFTLPQLKSTSTKYSKQSLIDLYEKITNMDFESKIGNIEPKLGLTLMVTLFEKYLTR